MLLLTTLNSIFLNHVQLHIDFVLSSCKRLQGQVRKLRDLTADCSMFPQRTVRYLYIKSNQKHLKPDPGRELFLDGLIAAALASFPRFDLLISSSAHLSLQGLPSSPLYEAQKSLPNAVSMAWSLTIEGLKQEVPVALKLFHVCILNPVCSSGISARPVTEVLPPLPSRRYGVGYKKRTPTYLLRSASSRASQAPERVPWRIRFLLSDEQGILFATSSSINWWRLKLARHTSSVL